jgi:two-component system, sensor histidine kinase
VGSIFFLQIPFAVNEAVLEQNSGRSGGGELSPWDGPPLRILLVDDQEINLVFAARILQRGGHTVIEARNGREALEKWGEDPVDLILMDVQMPVMNGVEATLAIREREKRVGGHIPIIAVTARALHQEREHILSQGFDGYVTKPFEIRRLLNEVTQCLTIVKGGADATA